MAITVKDGSFKRGNTYVGWTYRIQRITEYQMTTDPVNMPDPICIRAGSAGKRWPEAGRMILAHWLASGPDPFGLLPDRIRLAQNLTQSARTKSDPGWFCTILSWTSVEERNRV